MGVTIALALPEVLQSGRLWISRNFRAFEGFNSVALVYLVMTLLLSLLVRFIERKTAYSALDLAGNKREIYKPNVCVLTASLLFQVVYKMKSLNYLSITI